MSQQSLQMSQHIDILNETRRVVGPGPDVREAVAGIPTRTVPDGVRNFAIVAMVIGALALVGGLATDATSTRGLLLTCIVYFFGISQGGVMFAVISTITLGRWQRPFKRIAESFATFLPVVYVLWLLFLMTGGLDLYAWTHEEMPAHKAIWLNPSFFVARQVVLPGLLVLLSALFVRNSLRPDMGVAAEMLGATKAPAWWGRITLGWQGRDAEVETAYQRNIRLAPIIVVSYFIIFALFIVDSVMSLDPHWYANMFPAWIAVSSVWMTLSWVCILSVVLKKWMGAEHLFGKNNYHDLGKLMFALCIFWTYNFYAQVLPIWYGNMPEETGYLMLRMFATPWNTLGKVAISMCFLIPFTVLLSRGIKKTPPALATVAVIIVVGVFLERFLLVMPQVWKSDAFPPVFMGLGVWLGFVGAFVMTVTTFLSKVPPVAITDPFMNPNPFDVHVHVHDDHNGNGHGH